MEKRSSISDVMLAHSSIQCCAPHDTQTTSEKAQGLWNNEGVNGVKERYAIGGRDGQQGPILKVMHGTIMTGLRRLDGALQPFLLNRPVAQYVVDH